jgi:hypothetical protein
MNDEYNDKNLEEGSNELDLFHGVITEIGGLLKEHIPIIEDEIAELMSDGRYSTLDICYEISGKYGISFPLMQYFYNEVANAFGSAFIEQERINEAIKEEEEQGNKKCAKGSESEMFQNLLKQRNKFFERGRQLHLENEEFKIVYTAPDGNSKEFILQKPNIEKKENMETDKIILTFTEDDESKEIINWMLRWQNAIMAQNEITKKFN